MAWGLGHYQFRLKGAIAHLLGRLSPLERISTVGFFLSLRNQQLVAGLSPWETRGKVEEAQMVLGVLYIVSLT